jgi:hypothetical protein
MHLHSLLGGNAAKARRRGVHARDSELFRFGRVFLCLAAKEPKSTTRSPSDPLRFLCLSGPMLGRSVDNGAMLPSIVLEALPRGSRSSKPKSVAVPQIPSKPSLPHPRRPLAPKRGARDKQTRASIWKYCVSQAGRPPVARPSAGGWLHEHLGRNDAEPCGAVELSSSLPFLHSAYCVTALLVLKPGRLAKDTGGHHRIQGPDMARSARLPLFQQTTNQNNPRSGSAPTAAPHPGPTPCKSMFLFFVSHPTPGTPDGAVRSTKGP